VGVLAGVVVVVAAIAVVVRSICVFHRRLPGLEVRPATLEDG